MELILYQNKILREKCGEIKEFDRDLENTASEMLGIMYKNNGVGLSAPQVGIGKRLIAVNIGQAPVVLANPKVMEKSGKEIMEEGCLSFPGLFLKIERPGRIKVKAQSIKGESIEFETKGLLARVLQHEIDHLDGILFIDRIGFFKRWKIRKKLKELAKPQKT